MRQFFSTLSLKFRSRQTVPSEYQSNFTFLYNDTTWFGILNGSTLAFLSVYAARIGATAQQVGLIGAVPAIMAIIFTLPAGNWLGRRSISKAVFWSSFFYRLFYFVLVFLPILLHGQAEVWAIIIITLIMSIPAVPFTVGFNTLFAEAVPIEWRGHVAGIRNAFFSIATMVSTLVSGAILNKVVFPIGYQVIFLMGAIGGALSTISVGLVRPRKIETDPAFDPSPALEPAVNDIDGAEEPDRKFKLSGILRFELLSGSFGKIILLLFIFHLFQYLPIPIFPVYQVKTLHFNDQVISLGTAAFYVTVFLGSTVVARITNRWGNQRIAAVGAIGLASYPGLMAISTTPFLLIVTSLAGGLAWSMVGVASINYLLEKVPAADRPAHLAWYNLAFNTAILIGSLGGPAIAGLIGQKEALLIFAAGRVMAGLFILLWG